MNGSIERTDRTVLFKNCLNKKVLIRAIEVHDGISALIAERAVSSSRTFNAVWISSLCDSTVFGIPDDGNMDINERLRNLRRVMSLTSKPIIFDGDNGGSIETVKKIVQTLNKIGVSMVVFEDKIGIKQNSLICDSRHQSQDSISGFSSKIKAAKGCVKYDDFLICARIESLILSKGISDAILRADAYIDAGADSIMIHSREKNPNEIFTFLESFRAHNTTTPIVVCPTTYSHTSENSLREKGANIIVYANQLLRAGIKGMQSAAELILANACAEKSDEIGISIEEITSIVPGYY